MCNSSEGKQLITPVLNLNNQIVLQRISYSRKSFFHTIVIAAFSLPPRRVMILAQDVQLSLELNSAVLE